LIFIFGTTEIETPWSRKLIGDMMQSKRWKKEGTLAKNMRKQLLGKEKKRKKKKNRKRKSTL